MYSLSKSQVEEFQTILLDEFGVTMSYADAEKRAIEVLKFLQFIDWPPKRAEREEVDLRAELP